MESIFQNSKEFIIELYNKFKLENSNLFKDWYGLLDDDIEVNLLVPYYISSFESDKLIE